MARLIDLVWFGLVWFDLKPLLLSDSDGDGGALGSISLLRSCLADSILYPFAVLVPHLAEIARKSGS